MTENEVTFAVGIIAGASGLGGALIGSFTTIIFGIVKSCIDSKKKKKKILREKYEELSNCMQEIVIWIDKLVLCDSFEKLDKCTPPSELRKIIILPLLYFPLMEKYSKEISTFGYDFYCSLIKVHTDKNTDEIKKAKIRCIETVKYIEELRYKFDIEIAKNAKKYTGL